MKGATKGVPMGAGESGDISIHAPVKGATTERQYLDWGFDISIHAPVKGATYDLRHRHGINVNFNPRSREGSDRARLQ